jgi:hypothetical protein
LLVQVVVAVAAVAAVVSAVVVALVAVVVTIAVVVVLLGVMAVERVVAVGQGTPASKPLKANHCCLNDGPRSTSGSFWVTPFSDFASDHCLPRLLKTAVLL